MTSTPILSQTALAALTAFAAGVILCPIGLPWLRRLKFGQRIHADAPQSHQKKSGTPTMGGIMIVLAFVVGAAFFLASREAWVVVLAVVGFGAVGFCDDYVKIRRKKNLGLRAWQKMLMQVLVSVFVLVVLRPLYGFGEILLPFILVPINLGVLYAPFVILVFLATTNGANLADGMDGHLSSVTAVICAFFGLAALLLFNSDTAPIIGAMLGALLAFLVFNSHPASVFMGDTGALALGGFVAAIALVLGLPLFLFFAAIVYVIESMSVILQVTYFKMTKKRLFKMAPIHHTFEKMGYSETKIVWVSVVITAVGCLVGVLALVGAGGV